MYTTLAASGFISHRQASAREEGGRRTIMEENEQGNQDLEAPVEEEYALEQRVIPFMGDDLAAALTPMGTCCSTSARPRCEAPAPGWMPRYTRMSAWPRSFVIISFP